MNKNIEEPTKDKNTLISEIEKVKAALTQAQKELEDENYKDACDSIFASKLFLEPIGKNAMVLWKEKK